MISGIKSGLWLVERRVCAVSLMMILATLIAFGWIVVTGHGTLDGLERPIGTDFSNVYAAGKMASDGHAALAWNWPAHFAEQQALHHKANVNFYGWHYPPPFLLLATLLSFFPYLIALAVWQSTTLALCVGVLRQILPGRGTMLVGLGCPVVLVCLGHGHNGFLTGALLGGGLLLLERKPLIAGLLLGCLIYKPQFGLVLPVILLAGQHWRAIGGALISALILCGLTLLIWGWPVWHAFIDSLPLTQSVIIEQGSTGWEKIQSSFSAVRNWGGSIALAWQVQGIFTAIAVLGTAFVARGASPANRNAVILAAALLSTPYILDYDLVPLELGVAFLIEDGRTRGFLPMEKSLYAFVWMVPLVGRSWMSITSIPFGFIAILTIFMLALRRAVQLDACTLSTAWPFRRSHGSFAP